MGYVWGGDRVLGMRLSPLMCLISLPLVSACSGPSEPTPQPSAAVAVEPQPAVVVTPPREEIVLSGKRLLLVNAADGCVIKVDEVTHPIDIPAPCKFLRRGADAPPAMQDYGPRGAIALIGGPPAAASEYPPGSGQSVADHCSSTGRAVLVQGDTVAVSDILHGPASYCPGIAPDEKVYYGIAHAQDFAERLVLR